MKSFGVKYRPQKWEEVVGQESILMILKQQLLTKSFKNAYIFSGASGSGKTTCARIFANEINNGCGSPIEIDAASNNGVENVRRLSDSANERALDSEYKIYIIDECFPANTLVKLDKGYNRIDKIKVGDIVQSMSGYNKVTHIFKSSVLTSRLCCVIINNKKYITTSEHLFFTNNGWIKACDLQKGDIVYDAESLSKLWKEFPESSQECEVLLSSMFGGVSKENLSTKDENSKMSNMWKRVSDTELLQHKDLFCGMQEQTNYKVEYTTSEYRIWQGTTETIIRTYEEEQPDVLREEYTNNADYKREEWYTSSMERSEGWQREVYYTTDSLIRSIRRWLDFRVCNKHKESGLARTSTSLVLQSRPWLSNNEYCNRGRWQKPQTEKWIIERLKERGMSERLRVDSVEIYKRGDNDELFLSCFTDTELSQREVIMYDLEVENDHTYFADDILVHNCHSLSNTAWQAFLKTIEETPKYTIFIFCTTDPQKIPDTIKNRCMRFNFTRIPSYQIKSRLEYVCQQEGYVNYTDACDYISRICRGEMRNALSLLETCSDYSTDLSIKNVVEAVGNFSYDTYFELVNALIDGDMAKSFDVVNDIYNNGNDLTYFVNSFLEFVLDVEKYIICNDIRVTKLPLSAEENLKFATGISDASDFYLYLIDKLLELKNMIKNDPDVKSTIEVIMTQICRLLK